MSQFRAALAASVAAAAMLYAGLAHASFGPTDAASARGDNGMVITIPDLRLPQLFGAPPVVGLNSLASPRLDGGLPWCPVGWLMSVDGDTGHYMLNFAGSDSAVGDALVIYGYVCVVAYR